MATKIIEGKFMPQYKTAAQWSIANPVLLRGETGVESDTRKFKFGDGVNHWNDLEYANKAYPADIKMTDWAKMLESAYSPITNTDTLLAALQKLQVLVDNGDAYLFRCYGTDSTMSGVAFGSPDGLRGLRAICYNSWSNKILVCAGEITLPAFIRMSETEQAAWLGEHTEHSIPVTTAISQQPGFSELPINSQLKFADNKGTIGGLLRMLTASVCQGRLRTVVGNPSTGASGKPEIAFIVNNVQSASAETQGTNGLQIFHLTSDFIRVIPSTDIAMAWPTLQTLSDEAVIKKLNSTASGDWGSLGVKMPYDIQLGTNILNGSHADWVAANKRYTGYETGELLYLDHTLIRGKQITYRVELKGEDAQAPQLGFEIKVHFTDNTDQWLARYDPLDIPDRGTFEKTYTFSSQIQDKEIEYARLYPVFRILNGGEASGKLYVRHEFVGVGNKLPSTWSPSVADQKKYINDKVENIQIGGVNLLNDSESITFDSQGGVWGKWNSVNTETFEGYKCAVVRNHKLGVTNGAFLRLEKIENARIAKGLSYMASAYVWANEPVGIRIGLENSEGFVFIIDSTMTGKWIRLSSYQEAVKDNPAFVLYANPTTPTTVVAFRMAQLEDGNKVTAWSPSVADQKKYIDDKVDNIQIGGINIFSFSELEQGGINNGTGVPAASNTRLRSKSFQPISGEYISANSFNDIYKFLWLFYDEEYSYINEIVSWDWITSFPAVAKIPEGAAYVKYMISRNDNSLLTPDDAQKDCLIIVELGNKSSLSWSPSIADQKAVDPITISDFKNLPSTVTSAADGVIMPIIAPASASNGPTGLSSIGPAYGYVQVAKVGSTKAYNFLVQMNGSGSAKVYSGFLHSTAQTVSWTELGGDSRGMLGNVKVLTTSFWNLISSNDVDIQTFVIREDSPEIPTEYKGEGFGFARHYRDDVGMATVTIKLNSGRVKTFNVTFYGDGSDAYWEETGGSSGSSSGMEKISNWTDLRYAMVNSDEGQGQMVTLPLTRALKSTDIVLVTWRKENASNVDADIAGHAIFHPGAYSYDVGLEVVEDFQDSNNNYGLYLDQNTSEIGSTSLSAYAMSLGGNSYGPHYLITGIYNISGK